jgi:hypothetical protein
MTPAPKAEPRLDTPFVSRVPEIVVELRKLKATNARLLAALKELLAEYNAEADVDTDAKDTARALIAEVEK